MLAPAVALLLAAPSLAAGNLLENPSFEDGTAGWEPWSNRAGEIRMEPAARGARDGKRALRIVHTGSRDWSVAQVAQVPVRPGDIVTIAGWVNIARIGGTAEIGVILRDASGEVVDWIYAPARTAAAGGWRRLESRFMIPAGAGSVLFRITGEGPVELLADGLSLVRSVRETVKDIPPVEIRGAVSVRIDGAAFSVTAGKTQWVQPPEDPPPLDVLAAERLSRTEARLSLRDPVTGLAVTARIAADPSEPEVAVELEADQAGAMDSVLRWPLPFASRDGDFVAAPYAEGLLLPVSATGTGWGFECFRWKKGFDYGDWKTAMGFIAVTDLRSGYGLMVETPRDSSIELAAPGGRLAPRVAWRGEKGRFGYRRRIVWRFADRGGHVALAKRYRALAAAKGWIVTLAEKAKTRPAVAKLPGAVDLWFLERNLPPGFLDDLAACGVDRAIVSVGGGWREPGDADAQVRAAQAHGWLGSRYDIYTDVWNPADNPPKWLRTAGFPEDVIVDADGRYHRGWVDKSEGGPFQGYNLCSSTHARTARERIGDELERTPYGARFIDVICSQGLMECRAPAHPLTRRGDEQARVATLRVVGEEFRLATGTEEIREWAVPVSDWSEGTMTMKPVENAGYDWSGPVEPDDDYRALTAGAAFRIPLFELVFHDCHVSTWYTGDGSTKVPACRDEKDLLNILYGTMPLWMPTKDLWEKYRTWFLCSYHTVNTVFAAVGGAEMTDHEFLTPDRLVQRTRFASGHTVTANFGGADWTDTPSGKVLPRLGFVARGPGLDAWRARSGDRTVTRVETPAKVFLDPGGRMWGDRVLRADGPVVLLRGKEGGRTVPLSPSTKVERPTHKR